MKTPIQAFKWALLFLFFLLFPTFLSAPTFPYFFMKMPYYPYFFTLKCHLRVKIQKFFLAPVACSDFKLTSKFIQGARRLKPQFLMFNLKVSLFG